LLAHPPARRAQVDVPDYLKIGLSLCRGDLQTAAKKFYFTINALTFARPG
jgi:hypothetical protein